MRSPNSRRGNQPRRHRSVRVDTARLAAFEALAAVRERGAYANLALPEAIARHDLSGRDAAFTTALVAGTCRLMGTHERIIAEASGRSFDGLDAGVQQVLLLASEQVLDLQIAAHAAVDSSVDLARAAVGPKVSGLVNAISRRLLAHDMDGWLDILSANESGATAVATRTHHPRWIVEAFQQALGGDPTAALLADNEPASPTLVVRPGLCTPADLPGEPTRWSPFGVHAPVPPSQIPEVRVGRAGVQDEGSQLVAWALSRVDPGDGAADSGWLDLCAGPGGKAALLTGLARERDTWVVANEVQPHRAVLVRQALRAYPDGWQVTVADGRAPAWREGGFSRVMCDVPCSGLGALRRRPESRWRHRESDLEDLVPLQRELLLNGLQSVRPGGVVAYVTCSPHLAETVGVVTSVLESVGEQVRVLDAPAVLPEVPDTAHPADPRFVQLWPHRHGTDAMFLALLQTDVHSSPGR